MPETFDPALLEERIARADPDRFMAARFAPRADRPRLIAIYAFNYEIARVRERVTEPAIGDMRLAWWREAIDEIYDPIRTVRWHEAARALEDSFEGRPPPRLWLDRMINARGRDLDAEPFTSLEELSDYAESSAGALMRVAAWLLAPDEDLSSEAESAIAHAGAAWALTGMIRALPEHMAQGRPLPVNLADLTGVGATDASAWAAALEPVAALAREQHRLAREQYGAVPAACAPACIYAALVPAYLDRIARRKDPLRQPADVAKLKRQAILVAAAARGRI